MRTDTSCPQVEPPFLSPTEGRESPEIKVEQRETLETPVEPWRHLVRRRHPWRQQLYVKGRNMTALQLVRSMRASGFSADEAAADYRLSVEAVQEALAYVEKDKGLLDIETEIERLMLSRGGIARGPQPLP